MSISLDLGLTRKIIEVCQIRKVPLNQTAYILATAYWETGRTMEPVREAFYLNKKAEAYRKKLRYYPWYGRGLVQLTWEENYVKAGKRLGADFIKNPDLVMAPDYSVRILVIGMEEGWFTGKDLDDYIDEIDESDEEDRREFEGARRIINGVDKKKEIASLALTYEETLKEEGYEVFGTEVAEPAPTAVVSPSEATQTTIKEEKSSNIWVRLISIIYRLFATR